MVGRGVLAPPIRRVRRPRPTILRMFRCRGKLMLKRFQGNRYDCAVRASICLVVPKTMSLSSAWIWSFGPGIMMARGFLGFSSWRRTQSTVTPVLLRRSA